MNNLFTPMNQEEDEIDPITGLPMSLSQPVQSVPSVPVEAAPAPQIDTREYLMQKYNLGPYGDEGRAAAQEQTKLDGGDKFSAALMALGAGISGRDPAAAAANRLQQLQGQRNQSLDQFEKGRSAKIQDFGLNRDLTKFEREDRDDVRAQKELAENDSLDSDVTKSKRVFASKMAPSIDFSNMSGAQIDKLIPSVQKVYEINQKSIDRKEAAAERANARAESREDRTFQRELVSNEKQKVRDEKKKTTLNEVEDRKQNIEQNLTELEKMIKDKGTYEVFGSHNTDLDRRVDAIATDMAKLADPNSVARPSEVELFKKGLIQSNIGSMRNETALNILKNFRDEVNKRVETAYRVRGLTPDPTKQIPDESKSSFPKQVRKGNQVATVNSKAEEDEAKKEGFN